jgi:hypothetical protein
MKKEDEKLSDRRTKDGYKDYPRKEAEGRKRDRRTSCEKEHKTIEKQS